MHIRHECPMPDLSFAVTAPLRVLLPEGEAVTAHKWTLAGLWMDDDDPELPENVQLSIPFQGVDVSFPVSLNTAGDSHYSFVDLTVRQRETLAAFYQGVMSGRMVSTDQMITSLDTPVDLVPMGETEEEEAAGKAKAKPRVLRAIWNIAYYVILAFVLVGFLGGQIWTRLTEVDLQHARFVAPVSAYTAPEAGYVHRIYVREGDTVKTGEILVKLEDPDRESDVEEVRAEVLLAERRLRIAQERVDRHLAIRAQRRADLWAAFYELWAPWKAHEPRYAVYPHGLQAAWERLYAFDRGQDADARGYFDLLDALQAAAEERALDLRRWKRALRHSKSAANELVIRARENGTVFAVHTLKNTFVPRGELVVEVEGKTPRTAVGWLDDKMAGQVHIGMQADIAYTHRGEPKRTRGEIVDIQAGADTARPDKFGMILTIKAAEVGVGNSRKWFRRNAPAEITLDRSDRFQFWKGWFDGRA